MYWTYGGWYFQVPDTLIGLPEYKRGAFSLARAGVTEWLLRGTSTEVDARYYYDQ